MDSESQQTNSSSAPLPGHVQDALLQHPRVQQAVRNSAATNAPLSDPMVQQRVLSVCMERFPELAEKAPGAIVTMSNDADAQQKAKEFAGVPASNSAASATAACADNNVTHTIEQGHPVIRAAAFLGGTGSIVMAILQTVCFWDVFIHPLCWLLGIYQVAFSLTTVIFEAKPEWIRRVHNLDQYQNMLLNQAGFLAKSSGRGLFYIFQGTLWLGVAFSLPGLGFVDSLYEFLTKLVGVFLLLLGLSHLLMSCGIFPQDYAPKLIRGGRRMTAIVQGALSGVRTQQAEPPQDPARRRSAVESF